MCSARPQVRGPGKHARTVASVVALAVLAGCDLNLLKGWSSFGPIECEPTSVSLTGRVIDAVTREPIAGAYVAVPGQPEATTDAHGRFTVSGSADTCENGLYMDIWAEGYVPISVWMPAESQPRIGLYRDGVVEASLSH